MAKNRVLNPARILADIVMNPRSRAYKQLCAISTDENGFQSDEPAASIRSEITQALVDLLQGNYDGINQWLAEHGRTVVPSMAIRPVAAKRTFSADFYSTMKRIRIADHEAVLETTLSSSATPEQLVCDVLLRALDSGAIKHLALCLDCGRIFYRKSPKGQFCSDGCRYNYHNHSENRRQHYIKGKWYP